MPTDLPRLRFLADVGVSPKVVRWLRAEGHDATHLVEERLGKLRDEEIFQKAALEGRIVITHDLDFGDISRKFQSGRRLGVLIYRLNNPDVPAMIDRLKAALAEHREALAAGAVVIAEEARMRVRVWED